MIGWRDGKPNGIEVYDPLDEDVASVVSNFDCQASGNTLTAVVSAGRSRVGDGPDHRGLRLPGRRLERLASRLDRVRRC